MTERTCVTLIDAAKNGPSEAAPPRRTLCEIERDVVDARRQLAALQRDINAMEEMRDKLGGEVHRLRQEFRDALDALFPGMYPDRL